VDQLLKELHVDKLFVCVERSEDTMHLLQALQGWVVEKEAIGFVIGPEVVRRSGDSQHSYANKTSKTLIKLFYVRM
jgi:hypothetical protein